jgi:hypothetical protein
MSSNKSSSNSKQVRDDPNLEPNQKSNNQMVREAGYDNFKDFAESYGLKMFNHEDVEEAKAILDGFRKIDQQDWEAKQKK